MSKGTQPQRNLAIKTVKAKLHALPIETLEKLAKVPNDWQIPEGATTVLSTGEKSSRKCVLCFDYLKWNVCVFEHFDSTKARALVRLFQDIKTCEAHDLPASHLIRDNVSNSPTYRTLFNGLSPDIQMKETELPGAGRVFFFITEEIKFNIVSIESIHRNLS